MDRLKKLNGSMIAAIVLSVLLIMSVTSGATLAWFGSRDSASASLTMGEAIVVTVGEDYKQGEGKLNMALPVTVGGLQPGMSVTPNIKVQLQKSNSNALLRARFITSVEYPNNYVDAAYSNTTKYPLYAGVEGGTPNTVTSETAGYGRVLEPYKETTTEDENPVTIITGFKDNVYAGDMYYDYYNYLGQRLKGDGVGGIGTGIVDQTAQDEAEDEEEKRANGDPGFDITKIDKAHTKKVHLSRVKVRDAIVAQIGKTVDNTEANKNNGWTINGVRVAVSEANAAELEIRQRGVDLTDAINRVLQGQGGYSIDPSTGNLLEGGIKYTRRVADGWAYREADQAWYYLGSATNGFVIDDGSADDGLNTNGKTETVDKNKPIAKDIASYKDTTVGNKTVSTPNYALIDQFVPTVEGGETADPEKSNPYYKKYTDNDKNRNYLGGTEDDYSINRVVNEIAVLNQETIASVDLSQGDVSIDFLTKRFVLPTFINNDYAQAQVRFDFTVEAVQDYLVDPLQEATAAADRLPNNLVNAILVFNNAFPQTLYPHSTMNEDKVRATGSTANILPGGGDSGKVTVTTIPDGGGEATTTTKTSPAWKNTKYGETEITYVNTGKTQNDRYSYGYLDDATIGTSSKANNGGDSTITAPTATPFVYSYGADGKAGGGDDKSITSLIKGFGVKVDEYGDYVADYTIEGWYVRGTASSLGICPYLTDGAATPAPLRRGQFNPAKLVVTP